MVHDVAEHEGADRRASRHREELLPAPVERPSGVQLRVTAIERAPRARRHLVEPPHEVGGRAGLLRVGGRKIEVEHRHVEDVDRPPGYLRQVRGERAERSRLLVRLPGEPVRGNASEHPARGRHFMVVLGEQRLARGHAR